MNDTTLKSKTTRRPAVFRLALAAACLGAWMPTAALAEKSKKEESKEEESKQVEPKPFIEHVVRDVEGWKIHVDKRLLESDQKELGDRTLKVLANKLYEITMILPEPRVKDLQAVPIFVDLDHLLGGLQYHPDAGWLTDHGHDTAMTKTVHVPRADRLVSLAKSNHQPSVMLHELAHAYHDRVLGFDHPPILKEYRRVVKEKLYDATLHMQGHKTRHYALTDHKEYFAEMTEAYFGTNDFYPFVRGELKDYDPGTFALLEKIWGRLP